MPATNYASASYTGNGVQTTYAIPFPYRATADVYAEVNGTPVTNFTVAGGLLTFTVPPAAGADVLVYRSTSIGSRLVDYAGSASITEKDLDVDSLQAFYLAQEALDFAGRIAIPGADLTAAVAEAQLYANNAQTYAAIATAQVSLASAYAANALASQNAALTSANNAANSAIAAAASAADAANAATTALASRVAKTGDTMTGALGINMGGVSPLAASWTSTAAASGQAVGHAFLLSGNGAGILDTQAYIYATRLTTTRSTALQFGVRNNTGVYSVPLDVRAGGVTAYLAPKTGAVTPRWAADVESEHFFVEDFGAVGAAPTTGNAFVPNETAAIQAALDAANAAGGGIVHLRRNRKYRISSTLTIQQGTTLTAGWSLPDFRKLTNYSTAGVADMETFGGSLILDTSAKILVGSAASVQGVLILHLNIDFLPYNPGESGFGTNTAIELVGNSPVVRDCFIGGFQRAIWSNGANRPRITDVIGDCKNGVDILNAADLARVRGVNFWPFLTVGGRSISVNTTSNVITSVGHRLAENSGIYFDIDTPPAPLVAGTTYYVKSVTADTFQVSATPGGAAIDLTTTGGANCRVNDLRAQLYRTGTAFLNRRVAPGVNDWSRFSDCFCFGYDIGFQNDGANSTLFERCGADNIANGKLNSVAFYASGACDEVKFVSCQAAAHDFAFINDATNGGSGSATVSLIDCDFWTVNTFANRTAGITCGGSATARVRAQGTKIRGYKFAVSLNGAANLLTMNDTTMAQITDGFQYVGAGSLITTGLNVLDTIVIGSMSVASAATITLPWWSDNITVSGTTNISAINASWEGRMVRLIFSGVLTVSDSASVQLAGNFVTAANSTLTLVCVGGVWKEISRSTN
jgi:hypothetical protein